jgi:hypothetical protein
MDNPDPNTSGNPDPNAGAGAGQGGAGSGAGAGGGAPFTWKSQLSADLQGSAVVKKFDDTPDGLAKALESHNNLEKLLGHEKVPIPKGPDDVEGWNRFSKAMGIPDKADAYGLADMPMPESLKGMSIDKAKFQEVALAHKLTPAQTKGLWKIYNELNVESYQDALNCHTKAMQETISRLRGEWGDAYDVNVELGQTVINKFTEDKESNDFITAVLSQDPRGIRFLAKIGNQFAENKIGEFHMKRFSQTPDELQAAIEKETKDLDGPYMNQGNKFTQAEHDAAVARVTMLMGQLHKARQGQA